MTEIEQVKQEIKMLQSKLSFLEELEKHKKTPVEEAYKEWWGEYPGTETWSNYDETRWVGFQAGYEAGYEAAQAKDAGEYQPSPQTPEEVAEGLRNAMIQAKKDGVFDEPKFPKRPTLYEIIADWWDEIFVNNNPSGQNIESLVDIIAKDWIPQKREKQFSDSYSNGFDDALDLMRKLLK